MASVQLEKQYGNDWAKSKSRDRVRSMIERTLLKEEIHRNIRLRELRERLIKRKLNSRQNSR